MKGMAIACVAQIFLLSAECDVGCRREGFAGGWFVEKVGCLCYSIYNYKEITYKQSKRKDLPLKIRNHLISSSEHKPTTK